MPDHAPAITRSWVLHPELLSDRNRREASSALAEAVALAEALPGLAICGADVVRLQRPQPSALFGKGKIETLKAQFKEGEVDLVLIDGPVSPVQQRNLEKAWGVKILDRTGLILEIFSDRAATREGVLQVEMAALSYQRTRLVRAWTHLERQRGGLGFVGGPGETQIEADRRAIDEQLVRLRRQLDRVVKTRDLHRKARAKVPFPIVALVGYTNAGKSTLFNRLTGAEVMAKDMLFATLDPTMRAVELTNGLNVILSDTVGFISDLPTELVAAFRATLEEVLAADVICHVRDISHAETDDQARDVREIMDRLGVTDDTPQLEIWNKIDALPAEDHDAIVLRAGRDEAVHAVSSVTGEGLDGLLAALHEVLRGDEVEEALRLSFANGRQRAWLFERGLIKSETQTDTGFDLTVRWRPRDKKAYAQL